MLTWNQVVAFNVRELRLANGWSQEHCRQRYSAMTGRPVSKATWSSWERSVSKRVTRFDADEIAVLADLFAVPVGRLLRHPETGLAPGVVVDDPAARLGEALRQVGQALVGYRTAPAGAPA